MKLRHKLKAKLFPQPVEVRLVEILGGSTLTIGAFRHNGNPMTITLSRGRLLRSRRFRRAVVDGDGALESDLKWAIRIMGPEYEHNVVKAYEMDEQLEENGWRLAYVRAYDIWNNQASVRANLLPFLTS